MQGWRITWWVSALVALMSGAVFALYGTGEEGLRVLIRATARSSLLLFTAVYIASSLQRLLRSPASAWLLRNRRYLGVGFAVSHAFHAAAIYGLVFLTGSAGSDLSTLIAGNIGFALIFVMAVTSSDAAVARLGRQNWRRLHRTGIHYLWLIFLLTFGGQASVSGSAIALASTGLLLAAAALRLFVWRRG